MGRRAEDRLSALDDVLPVLRCPVCGAVLGPLEGDGGPRVLGCTAGHRFDVARQGHVVLVPGGSRLRADTAAMVAARLRVMASGTFDHVRAALAGACAEAGTGTGLVLDLGAGPGTYTAAVLDALPLHQGLALELSVPALRAAARAHPRLAAVGADLS
ncbi:putative RNA methyltransferase, partial [Aquipuribacter hungaricus]